MTHSIHAHIEVLKDRSHVSCLDVLVWDDSRHFVLPLCAMSLFMVYARVVTACDQQFWKYQDMTVSFVTLLQHALWCRLPSIMDCDSVCNMPLNCSCDALMFHSGSQFHITCLHQSCTRLDESKQKQFQDIAHTVRCSAPRVHLCATYFKLEEQSRLSQTCGGANLQSLDAILSYSCELPCVIPTCIKLVTSNL